MKNMTTQPDGVWFRAGSFSDRNNQGRFRATDSEKAICNYGVRGGGVPSHPKVGSMKMEWGGEAMATEGSSTNASSESDREAPHHVMENIVNGVDRSRSGGWFSRGGVTWYGG